MIRTDIYSGPFSVHAYAQWLEAISLDWRHFPIKAEERRLLRCRGVQERDRGALAASLASRRMGTVLRFYRWSLAQGLLSPGFPLGLSFVGKRNSLSFTRLTRNDVPKKTICLYYTLFLFDFNQCMIEGRDLVVPTIFY